MAKFFNLRLLWFLLLILTTSASVVYASGEPCYRDGQSYPHGSRVGDYICINGEWLPSQ